MRKIFLLISAIALLALGCNAKTNTQSQINPSNTTTQNSSAPASSTLNWKTYANSKFGYSFQYPNEFKDPKVYPDGSGIALSSDRGELDVQVKSGKINPTDYESIGGSPADKIKVGDKSAYQIFTGDAGCEGTMTGVDLGNQSLNINFHDCEESKNPLSQDQATINSILATFKFSK